MIDHTSLAVADLAKSKGFFQRALAPLGYSLIMEVPDAAGLGEAGKPDFWIGKAKSKTQPVHIAFGAANRKAVDEFYHAAIAAGGRDNGKPGLRKEYHPTYYGAFVIDLDGNNIEAVCHKPE